MELAKLVVKLLADTSELRKGLQSGLDKVKSFGGSVAKGFLSMGQGVLGFVKSAIRPAMIGVAGLGAGLIALANNAAPLQNIEAAFQDIAAASGQAHGQLIQDLQEASGHMVTNRDLMTTYNKAAQLVSVEFANNLPNSMGALQKVAAATGQDMGFLMDSLVTGVGRLSPMILDNLGIQVDLNQAYQDYADANGLVASEMSKTQQQAALMAQVQQKLTENTANMPEVVGTAAQQIAAFKAGISNAKDALGKGLLPLLAPVISKVAEFAQYLEPLVNYLVAVVQDGDTLNDWLTHLPKKWQGPIKSVGEIITKIQEFISLIRDGDVQGALSMIFPEAVASKIVEIAGAIKSFVTDTLIPFVKDHAEEFQGAIIGIGIALAAAGIVAAIVGIVGALGTLFSPIGLIIAVAALLGAAWKGNWGGIQEKTKAVIDFLKPLIQGFIQGVKDWWAQHGDGIIAKASAIWEKILSVFTWFKDQFMLYYYAFKAAFSGDWERFGEILRVAWDRYWAKIREIGTKAWEKIKSFFSNTDWGQVGKNILEGIANGILNGIRFIQDAARNAAQAALDAAKGFLGIHSPSKVFEQQVGLQMGKGIQLGFDKSINDLTGKMSGVMGQLAPSAAAAGTPEQGSGSAVHNIFHPNAIVVNDPVTGEKILSYLKQILNGDIR